MNKTQFELPEERLATTDEKGHRVYLYPADVRGFFKKLRVPTHALMIFIFLVLPWIKIGGHQAILLDIAHRKFAILGITFWAHDAPIIFFVLSLAAFGVAFITTLFGRLWCGWACPETVFVEGLYRKIERFIEGTPVERRALDRSPWTAKKIVLKSLKWAAFLLVSLVLTHSFMAYFVGTEALYQMIQSPPSESPTAFLFMAASTALILIAFGWFREQFCIIVCPYGRLQSVLLDQDSLIVTYDENRGEPRRRDPKHPDPNEGDCINCYRCVQVCPTGIDIRRGLQMECIACTACIDACDEIMEKVHKPKGLIRYDTKRGLDGEKTKWLRPRVFVYLGILALLFSAFTYVLEERQFVNIAITRGKGNPFQSQKENPTVTNHFVADLSNHQFYPILITLKLPKDLVEANATITTRFQEIRIEPGKSEKVDFFIQFPKSVLKNGKLDTVLEVSSEGIKSQNTIQNAETQKSPLTLLGPFR